MKKGNLDCGGVKTSHECDLATLAVDDAEFWDGVQPLRFGGVPALQDEVRRRGEPVDSTLLRARMKSAIPASWSYTEVVPFNNLHALVVPRVCARKKRIHAFRALSGQPVTPSDTEPHTLCDEGAGDWLPRGRGERRGDERRCHGERLLS